ncbi:hypothetical protein LOC67_09375 [Stieleria sp. JC731]|uniref:hypothetical protein n=1 Tax=Pirellulaceae TaxID=2691357 RepID=UPI001E4D0E5F|nr:hypothetical protein [Stieleria sp. JC731]MCC9600774.1 hypothetical protein [Stieleria sp. JC731]
MSSLPINRLSTSQFRPSSVTAPQPISTDWDAMVAVVPSLAEIEARAKRRRRSRNRFLAYEGFKRELERHVGWTAQHPGLRTFEHWDVAIERISKALGV